MPTTQTKTLASTPTPEQVLSSLLGVTGDLETAQALQQSLPGWLLKSSSSELGALDQSIRNLQASREKVEKDLAELKPLKAFCIAQLTNALSSKWNVEFDVEADHLELPGEDCGCVVTPGVNSTQTALVTTQAARTTTQTGTGTVQAGAAAVQPAATDPTAPQATPAKPVTPPARQSLLEAAMQNFTDDEAQDDGFPQGSVVKIASAPDGVTGLTPQTFAAFCRELDLGKRYQTHFQQVFGLMDKDGKVLIDSRVGQDMREMKKRLLQLDMKLALGRNHITASGVETLQRLIDAKGVATATSLHLRNQPLIMQGIEAHGTCIWGVVVFSVRSVEQYPDEWCLIYMPGEPYRPLCDYPSFTAFKQYLTLKLGTKTYKDYFAHSIDEDDKVDFFKTFADKRDLGVIKQLPITVSLFDFMLQSHIGKLQIDARKIAVPTADIDEEKRKKRLLDYTEGAMTVASVAGFFVPVVGQLMMGVAVGQLLGEVFEGVEDWRHGDREEAFRHLLGVVENIALMGVAAVGQKAIGALVKKTVREHAEFFAPFTNVLNSTGNKRLWKPQLESYEQVLPGDASAMTPPSGLLKSGGKAYGRIDNRVYGGSYDATLKTWTLAHPTRKDAFAPVLKQHSEGGWRHPHEFSESESRAGYLLRRTAPDLQAIEDVRLDMARRISETPLAELQHNLRDNRPFPPRLRDTLERIKIGQRVDRFIAEMEAGTSQSASFAQEQLHSLPRLKNWPTDRYIQVVGEDDSIIGTYPKTSTHDDTLSVIVSQQALNKGALLDTVLAGLYSAEVQAMLGAKVGKSEQGARLAKTLGAAVKADRQPLFDHLYQRYDQNSVDDVLKLCKTWPELPAGYAQELIDRASTVQLQQLRDNGRVPLALAQKVRQASTAVRMDRLLSAMETPDFGTVDGEKLVVQLLARLNGWDPGMRFELREGTLKGPLLAAIGEESATALNTFKLVKTASGHEVFDGAGKSLGQTSGPESLYEGVLTALPPSKRLAVGFPDPQPVDKSRLRKKLLDVALDERAQGARMTTEGLYEPAAVKTPCTQADPPLTSSKHPRNLLNKVRRLFPLFTDAQAESFLDGLGADTMTRATRVKALRQALEHLREALEVWAEYDPQKTIPGVSERNLYRNRQSIAFQIEDCFRRRFCLPNEQGKPVYALNFDGMRIDKLPTLPPDVSFDHVKKLSLKNMRQGDGVGEFLALFKQVESLELDGNTLSDLPQAVSTLGELRHLSLADNEIRLTETSLAKLAELRTLHSLNLSGNRLGATIDVSNMFDLRYLSLRNTHATELPKGLSRLPYLDRVDLRNNSLQELPKWLFDMPKRFTETINLRHNVLSKNSESVLKAYRDRVGIGMGYLEDDLARLDEQQARSLWFTEGAGKEWSRRDPVWNAFKDEPYAEGLFHLLAELGGTADSIKVREDMTRRVWAVLEAAASDSALRERVLNLAANPINCTDSAALNFSHLEVAVTIDKVTRAVGNGQASVPQLLQVGRELFRLEQLEQVAQEHVRKNPLADPLEVSLAYRTGLAEFFDLTGQPRHMLYASLSGVTSADLEAAKSKVTNAELSSRWMDFIVSQPFWSDHLKRSQAEAFAAINETYPPKIQALFEKADTLNSADYLKQMDAIMLEKELAENTVFKRLTTEAIRQVDLGVCTVGE